jgi:hypothetical protein
VNWVDKLERKLGFIAIPNLILYVIGGQVLATLIGMGNPTLPMLLWLDPASVAAGQWWRLFTWIIVPSLSPLSVVFAVFWFMFLWQMGQTLEAEWGAFKCTLYLLLGVFMPAAGAMLAYQFLDQPVLLTGWYFSATVQLAFAALNPEFTFHLYFLLPVKMRWWAWVLGAYLTYFAFSHGVAGLMEVLFGVSNYLLFFLPLGVQAWRLRKQVAEGRKVFTAAKREATVIQTRRCHQCGLGPTEADLRLCTCERCGSDGLFWCVPHLGPHLEVPKKSSSVAVPKKKRKG